MTTAKEAYQEALKINRALRAFENFEAVLKVLSDYELQKEQLEKDIESVQVTYTGWKNEIAKMQDELADGRKQVEKAKADFKEAVAKGAEEVKLAKATAQTTGEKVKKSFEAEIFKLSETKDNLVKVLVDLEKAKVSKVQELTVLQIAIDKEKERVSSFLKGL